MKPLLRIIALPLLIVVYIGFGLMAALTLIIPECLNEEMLWWERVMGRAT